MNSELTQSNHVQVQEDLHKAKMDSQAKKIQREKEDRVRKSKETPTLIRNLCISCHSNRYFKPLKEGATPHKDYAHWFLPRTQEEIKEKKESIRKECIDDELKLYKKKLFSTQKKLKNNLNKTLENYNKQIAKQRDSIKSLKKSEENMMNEIKDMKESLEKVTKRLNEETDGFADNQEQLDKFMEHLKLYETHRLKPVTRLIQKKLQLKEKLSEMENEEDESGEIKKYGKLSDLKDDNEIAIEEINAKIQELEMQKEEEREKVEEFDNNKIDELVKERHQELLNKFVEPTDDDLRYRFNYMSRLPPKSYKELHKFTKYAKWSNRE